MPNSAGADINFSLGKFTAFDTIKVLHGCAITFAPVLPTRGMFKTLAFSETLLHERVSSFSFLSRRTKTADVLLV